MRTGILLLTFALAAAAADPDIETLMQNGHWKRARAVAEGAFQAHPNGAREAWLLARVRKEFQNVDEAVRYAEMAVRLDPKVAAYRRMLGEAYADQIDKLPFYKQLGQSQKIRAEYDAALSLSPNDPDALADRIGYLLTAPGIAGGDKKKAADTANELLVIDPARGYLALARVARAQKEDGKLEALYRKAMDSNPRNYGARIALAGFYLEAPNRDLRLVDQHAGAAVEVVPDRIAAYRLLAYSLAAQKRYDETAKMLARAEAAVPDDVSPYVYAARSMLHDGAMLPKAEGYLMKYLMETKEPEPGAPLLAGVHWSLGQVYEKEGRVPDAKKELETALRLKPDFEPAKRDLKRLSLQR